MNPRFFGDSYDLVKRFFCRELSSLGYVVSIDPMLTGNWNGRESEFYRLIAAAPITISPIRADRTALFVDPDTGVNERESKRHVSLGQLASQASRYSLVLSFDQSFSFSEPPKKTMDGKLSRLQAAGCEAMYYDSHARFLFVSKSRGVLDELRAHLLSIGLPAERLISTKNCTTSARADGADMAGAQ